MSDLCFLTAVELAERIRRRDVSVTEVVRAHLAQIERVNPKVNAIVTLTAERALDDARDKDARLARGERPGPLFGLPIAHKDLVPTRGIRTTWGSPIYRNHVPTVDGLIIERLRAAGAVTVGKTNTPEFGAGSQTFNEVFGRTLNPYDPTKTCGGSSGGAAVALACGMVPIADGSDTGGSLRNPAAFCNIVGFRTSPGRVPVWPRELAWSTLSVQGPMLAEHRHQIKDTVIWNTEQGLKLTARELADAEVKRTALYHRVREFMERYEFLLLPTTQVPPFDVAQPYVTEIEGAALPTYIDWMRSCSDITVTGLPAIAVPGGFTPDGLPVGLQIVGRHQNDWGVLELAHAFEQATGVGLRRPAVAT